MCKVLSEKNAYKSVKTALLLSNFIDADQQNSYLFTNKGHLSSPILIFIGSSIEESLARVVNGCN